MKARRTCVRMTMITEGKLCANVPCTSWDDRMSLVLKEDNLKKSNFGLAMCLIELCHVKFPLGGGSQSCKLSFIFVVYTHQLLLPAVFLCMCPVLLKHVKLLSTACDSSHRKFIVVHVVWSLLRDFMVYRKKKLPRLLHCSQQQVIARWCQSSFGS